MARRFGMQFRTLSFNCPVAVAEALDLIAEAELMSRSDVLRRAVMGELRALGLDRAIVQSELAR